MNLVRVECTPSDMLVSLSLANDLKSLKDREERLLRITDNALQDDSLRKSQRVDGNTLMNSSLDNSWSNALGLEE